MRRMIVAVLGVALLAACGGGGGGGDDDDDNFGPLTLESASLQTGEFNSCDVVGTIFNDDNRDTCSAFVEFGAFNAAGTLIASGNDLTGGIPPGTRATYEATLLAGSSFIACSEITRFELTDSSVFCD